MVGRIPFHSWRKAWLPTPNIFLPREFHGQNSMVGYSLWSHKESNTTEKVIHTQHSFILLKKASENLGVLSAQENRRKTFLGIVRLQTYLSFLVEIKSFCLE